MPKYCVHFPVSGAILEGRIEAIDQKVRNIMIEITKEAKKLGADYQAEGETIVFQTHNLEEAREFKKKMEALIKELAEGSTVNYADDCVTIST